VPATKQHANTIVKPCLQTSLAPAPYREKRASLQTIRASRISILDERIVGESVIAASLGYQQATGEVVVQVGHRTGSSRIRIPPEPPQNSPQFSSRDKRRQAIEFLDLNGRDGQI